MSQDNLEIQYSPSFFSKRFSDRQELLDHYFNFSLKESIKTRNELNCHLNIAYGEGERQKIDIYGDNLPSDAPILIFIHGGYWQEMSKNESAFLVQVFVKKGIRCLIIGYDLCPVVTLEILVKQIEDGFLWIADYTRKNNVKKIAVAGHSAGAHLLAFGLSEEFLSKLPKEVSINAFFLSGVYCLDELRHLKAVNENNILSLNDENERNLSPQHKNFDYLKNYQVQVHIFAGKFESDTFKQQSKNFAEGSKIREFCTNFDYLEVDHFDIIEKFITDEDYSLTKLIRKCLE